MKRTKILHIIGLNNHMTNLRNVNIRNALIRQLDNTDIGLGILLFLRKEFPRFKFYQLPTEMPIALTINNKFTHYAGSPINHIRGSLFNININIEIPLKKTQTQLVISMGIQNNHNRSINKNIRDCNELLVPWVPIMIDLSDPLCFEKISNLLKPINEISYDKGL